ncbi:polyamine ABC transporter substrate-binding protein [Psychromonas ossibalaenae]|uniref:polyamine ABC transporter substrate-binding protein n=1 Tax=Psychromonas ossibalaenae TaxID=444922 RepID=UPI0003617A41|nr:spermidine/putrescine ABC transporter substrate-binding protein [Psychromonas ossibalaenae]
MRKIIPSLSTALVRRLIISTILFTSLLLNSIYCLAAAPSQSPAKITFLTWGDYINPELVTQFEAEYNAKVNFVYFESDDDRDELLINTDALGYDMLMVDSVNLLSYKKLGWISAFNTQSAPNINFAQLPELSSLNKRDQICAPYSWGTTGIAYRKDLVAEPITSWKQVFTPAPELQGKILMSNMSKEVVGMALKSLGYSMTSSDSQELEQARQLLLAQAPSVAGYSPVASDTKKAKLVTGQASVTLTYSGDALMLQALEPQVEYVLPKEGGGVWADFICLSAKASSVELAHQFINYINRPQQAADNAQYIYCATPNSEAEKLLPSEFLNNSIIYPDKALVAQSETYTLLSPRTIKKHNTIMRELRNAIK